jgi:hypothetical protein
MASKINPQHVVTGKVRLSYVHLFTPYANPNGGDPKYSTTLLIPKSDVATKQRIDAAIQAAIQAGTETKWNGVRPPQVAVPVHDGDGARPSDGMPFGEECKGCWVVTASTKQPPQVVDLSVQPILDQTEIYSGIYARVSIRFFPYANSGKKGVGCGLGNVQKLEDGEPLGGRTTAVDDFGDGAGFAAAPVTGYPQQPVQQPQTYPQPQYQTPAPPAYQQPQYQQAPVQPIYPQQPVQIDPITGKPVTGGVMGL